jgi:hypothetical protein
LAELSGPDGAQRADLLREAVRRSKDQALAERLDRIAGLLDKNQLSNAIDDQQRIAQDLKDLLDLMLREEKDGQRENQRQRIRNLLKQLGQLLTQQRSLKARTESGDDPGELAEPQARLAETAAGIEEKLSADEEDRSAGSASEHEESPSQPAQSEAGQKAEAEEKPAPSAGPGQTPSADGKPTPSESKSGPRDRSDAGDSGTDGPGDASDPSQDEQSPEAKARDRVAAARERMEQARQELEKAARDEALEQQRRAIEALQQARAELDRILRQLRDEERQQMLVGLEARLRRMLIEQNAVYQATCRLDAVAVEQRGRDDQIEAGRLGRQESLIAAEADRALAILRDDGASVAFPEAIAQMRDDIEQVVDRLGNADVSTITQRIELDIIEALREAIQAVEQMLKDLKSSPLAQEQIAQGQMQERRLVEQLAELKMIRSLQLRVNRRTQWCQERWEDQPLRDALLSELGRLAQQQQQIERATRELASGRNQ